AAIANSAVDPHQPSKLCATAIETFVSILASEAGNLALKVMAIGGIYLAGSGPLHALGALEGPGFMAAFKRQGRFAELMGRIPVHVVLNRAALLGAAAYGLESFKGES